MAHRTYMKHPHGARHEPRLRRLEMDEEAVYWRLREHAAEQEPSGAFSDADMELLALDVAREDTALLARTIEKLLRLDLLDRDESGRLAFTDWGQWRFGHPSDEPDRVRERVQRHRDRQRAAQTGATAGDEGCNDPVTTHVTTCNDPVTTCNDPCNDGVTTPVTTCNDPVTSGSVSVESVLSGASAGGTIGGVTGTSLVISKVLNPPLPPQGGEACVSASPSEAEAGPEPEAVGAGEAPPPPGRAGKKRTAAGTLLPEAWRPSMDSIGRIHVFARQQMGRALSNAEIRAATEEFCDYWRGVPGAKALKRDWDATWRNWLRRRVERGEFARTPAVEATPGVWTGVRILQ